MKCAGFSVMLQLCEDVLMAADIPGSSADLSVTQDQILSAQFECYLKIMYDPPHQDSGETHTNTH